jgi:hypothetical protein
VTYREVADPTCAGCGALLEREQTYYDPEGAPVCPRCHKLGEMGAARRRIVEDGARDTSRMNASYLWARVLIAAAVLAAAYVASLCSHR